MVLYGAGDYAKVVLGCLRDASCYCAAIFDDDDRKKELAGIPVRPYHPQWYSEQKIIVTIGNNAARRRVSSQIRHSFGTIVHSSALVDEEVVIGVGSVVLHGAIIQAGSQLGCQVMINSGASIDHDCLVGDFVHLAPRATLCGNVQIGQGALVGAGAVILPRLTVGNWALIGAGAVVTHSVPDYAVVFGNPARPINDQSR